MSKKEQGGYWFRAAVSSFSFDLQHFHHCKNCSLPTQKKKIILLISEHFHLLHATRNFTNWSGNLKRSNLHRPGPVQSFLLFCTTTILIRPVVKEVLTSPEWKNDWEGGLLQSLSHSPPPLTPCVCLCFVCFFLPNVVRAHLFNDHWLIQLDVCFSKRSISLPILYKG